MSDAYTPREILSELFETVTKACFAAVTLLICNMHAAAIFRGIAPPPHNSWGPNEGESDEDFQDRMMQRVRNLEDLEPPSPEDLN